MATHASRLLLKWMFRSCRDKRNTRADSPVQQQNAAKFYHPRNYMLLYDEKMAICGTADRYFTIADLVHSPGVDIPFKCGTLSVGGSPITATQIHEEGIWRKLTRGGGRNWTEYLIGTSAHAPHRPMVTYIGMGTVGPGPPGLLRH
ncbi:hypothetical protein TNCV_3414341 [Trichonephila clavipes]|uniref:Uncharacterized protein n=1 Tax=Trichonephila clavipes TaxID=2585209 RepID=A0A8X6RK33_TRICX|nr:hypothetical protein TNCV_3414341 [Trichonephila clavipes]